MTVDKQPEALRLAERMESYPVLFERDVEGIARAVEAAHGIGGEK